MAGSGERKVVVITGGSAGIGAQVARRLGAEGHALVLAARREDALRSVASEIGGDVLTVVADVTERAQVERIRDEALRRFGHVDVWINNAGRGITRSVLELTDADVDDMITTNVKSALYGMQAIVPHFQARGTGHLVNVSSFLGRVPMAGIRSAYSAAKAALNSLTTNLRMDLRERWPGIHVSLVMPGIVATDFAANALAGAASGTSTNASSGPPPAAPSGPLPMQPQSVEDAAERIVHLVDHPAPEIYTNPVLPEIARRWFDEMNAFTPME